MQILQRCRRFGYAALVMLFASCVCAPAVAQPALGDQAGHATRSFPLQHREAGDLADQVRQLMGGDPMTRVFVDAIANKLVVRGPADKLLLAEAVVAKLDQPAAAGNAAVLEAYEVPADKRGPIEQWSRTLGVSGDSRAAWDPRTGQLLVLGPPALHAEVTQRLQAGEPQARRPRAAAGQRASGVAENKLKLTTLSSQDLHARLQRLAGRPLQASWTADRGTLTFPVRLGEGSGVQLSIDAATREVRLTGDSNEVSAWTEVIKALDAAPSLGKESTGVVASKNARGPKLRQALGAIDERNEATNSRLVTMLFQREDGVVTQPAGATAEEADQEEAEGSQPVSESLAGAALLGPVQIEFIEELDIIVVRGNEGDVQRVLQIINQIETLSEVTVPEIQVFPLQHVDSVSMGRLMQRVYQDVLGPRTGSVSITPLGKPDALLLIGRNENVQTAVQLIRQLDQPVSPTARMQAFRLQHALAADAEELVTRYFASDEGGNDDSTDTEGALAGKPLVVADNRSNTLVVRAAPRDMVEIAELLKRIDRPSDAQAELKVFTIKNGDAEALADMLGALFGVEEDDETGGLGSANSPLAPLQITYDQRTNSVIAAGSAEDLAVVEAILLRLDQDGLRQRETRVFRLNNAFAPEVADALNQLIEDQREAEEAADLTISPFEQIDREVIVVAEQATNTLIVSANPSEFDRIEKLVTDLDARPPMVMIQVLIAEVRLNDTDEFGLELGLQDSLLFDRSLVGELNTVTTTTQEQSPGGSILTTTEQTIVNAPLTPGFNFNDVLNATGNNGSTSALATAGQVAAQGLTNFAVGRANNALGFGGFVFSASSNSVSMLLRALQENRRLEVLSRPQVMMLDNQQGLITVGQRVPVIQQTNLNQFGQQINNFQYEDVGITLDVTPRISPDNTVVMQIRAERSAVGNEADGIPIFITPGGEVVRTPPIDQTLAQTTVSAASGQTVVLSGLLTKNSFDVHRRVPILADIPLLGDLFRYDSVQQQRTELLIIMTPRVVRSQEDAEMIKQVESARMSWVMCDVVNLHGPSGLRGRDDEWMGNECEEVYPTMVPTAEQFNVPGTLEPPANAPPLPMETPLQFPERSADWKNRQASTTEVVTPAAYKPAPSAAPRRLPVVSP